MGYVFFVFVVVLAQMAGAFNPLPDHPDRRPHIPNRWRPDLGAIVFDVNVAPPRQDVTAGETVTFRCAATSPSGARATLTWTRLHGQRLQSNARDDGRGMLVIYGVLQRDAGQYVCSAVGGAFPQTATAELTIRTAPPVDPCDRSCTREYVPVCDSEGTTHSNRCAFEIAQCKAGKRGKRLSIASEGECVDRPRPDDDCERACTLEYAPVCDSEGTTHSNNCGFEVARCKARKQGRRLSIASQGECGAVIPDDCDRSCTREYAPVCDSEGSTHSNNCAFEIAQCKARKQRKRLTIVRRGRCEDEPEEVCNQICTLEYEPVCDSEGKTHGNNCAFETAQCRARKTGKRLTLAKRGRCDDEECNRACPLNLDPVCDSEGKTHANDCVFEAAQCEARKTGKRLTLAERGRCEDEECNRACPLNLDPVCDSEGKTHANDCVFEAAQCEARKTGKRLTLAKRGNCDDENCDRSCPLDRSPVCDSEGVTHGNECAFGVAQCRAKKRGKTLSLVHRGQCAGGGGCSAAEFKCSSGECIARTRLCDRRPDCRDSSDEPPECGGTGDYKCEPNQYECPGGKCIMKIWKCDGDDDCGDGWDERNCPVAPPGSRCAYTEWSCHSRHQCIPYSYLCDDENDCADGSDEIGCVSPTIERPPPPTIRVCPGETVEITCKARGRPIPIISWRLNWGHTCITNEPQRCECVCKRGDGEGKIIIRNVQAKDQGAYTCEAMNNKGPHANLFAIPDAILELKDCSPPTPAPTPAPAGCNNRQFNALQDQPPPKAPICVDCFCFGHTTLCDASQLKISKVSLFDSRYKGDTFDGNGHRDRSGKVPRNAEVNCMSEDAQFQVVARHIHYESRTTRFNPPIPVTPQVYINDFYSKTPGKDEDDYSGPFYWTLPDQFRGNHLTSYGYHLRYTIRFTEPTNPPIPQKPTKQPDVILVGNNEERLYWHADHPTPGVESGIAHAPPKDVPYTYRARFHSGDIEGRWTKDRDGLRQEVSRKDLMMVMQNVMDIMIRATYDENMINTHLLMVEMEYGTDRIDIVLPDNTRATWVENCQCPAGYTGTSCEDCADGYSRTETPGPALVSCEDGKCLLGKCVRGRCVVGKCEPGGTTPRIPDWAGIGK